MKTAKAILLALVSLTASVNLFAQTAEEWKKRGNAEADNDNPQKAIEYYQKAIETDSTYFDAYLNMGIVFYGLSDLDKAIEYCNKAIAVNDTIADSYFLLGYIYREKQDYDKTIEWIKQGIKLKPDSPKQYNHLGWLYQEKGGSPAYAMLYAKKAAQLGDTLARQYFIGNQMSWEDNFAAPDYEQIKSNIEDKRSDFYYSKIWDKFQQGDSTMTVEEKRHLYYGYVFNTNYSPYRSMPGTQRVNAILNKESPAAEDWEELISLLNIALSLEPFGCRNLYYQSLAYDALGKHDDADKNHRKMRCIVNALDSTGDGLSQETAIHVIGVSSEYDYLFVNGLSSRDQSLMSGGYDVLSLSLNEAGMEEIWFDINQPLNYLSKTSGK